MSQQAERHLVLARLREEIRRIEHRPARRGGIFPCGLAEVDAALPGGGFPRGALSELTGGPASGKTAVALALFAALGREDLAAYVDGRGELYPPAAAARGIDLSRLLVVRPGAAAIEEPPRGAARRQPGAARPWIAGLWAAEALLASGAFAAIAIDVPIPSRPARGELQGADAIARRMQAAAERGGAAALWLASGRGLRVPAAIRIELVSDGERIRARRVLGGRPSYGGGTGRAA